MKIGIVGSEQAKFTPITETAARTIICDLIHGFDAVISGECHLGGVDIYAKEEALAHGMPFKGFPPKKLQWEGGYKQRNLEIAKNSDTVVCITIEQLPPEYNGMKFELCYHCKRDDHVKSGGCWTAKQASRMGKDAYLYVIKPDGSYYSRAI